MTPQFHQQPPKPKKTARLGQLSKSNKLMRRYYNSLRKTERDSANGKGYHAA